MFRVPELLLTYMVLVLYNIHLEISTRMLVFVIASVPVKPFSTLALKPG